MVSKSQARRQRDIKSKLMAAIAMLLVSSIMMVSSTYAWFTLSTAPEVTGINTAVGANGNLEMALMTKQGLIQNLTDFGITSSAGDSTLDIEERNVTWGNLVDLSDSTIYGLDQITLFPSRLNETAGTIGSVMLATPTYGADGRIDTLTPNTVNGYFDKQTKSFSPNENYGVRAVGTASGMTDRQLDYRNARSNANTAKAQAANLASQSLNNNGSSLANIAISYGMDSTNAKFTQTDVASLRAIIDDLQEEGGVLDQIETAYMQYILAYGASSLSGEADTAWQGIKALVTAEGATLTSVVDGLTGVTLPEQFTTAIEKYKATVATVATADTELKKLEDSGKTEFTWDEIKVPMQPLANPTAMEINGYKASEVKDKLGDLVSSVTANGGLVVTMATGAGVYADIADHCGDYSASITIEKVEYQGITLNNMNARMNTATTVIPQYLSVIGAAVENKAPESGDANALPITDMYGYVIDMAFRTNAAESKLLLQADAADRIYEGNTNEETMGHGSSMTFAATTTDFSNEQVKSLMGSIRLVFFVPTLENGQITNKIVARAKLDVANATTGTDGITAKMYIYTISEGTTTYEPATEGATHVQVISYEAATGEDAKYIVDTSAEDGYRPANEGETATHKQVITYQEASTGATHKAVTTGVGDEVKSTDNAIMALTQNTAHALSVLVYLDGDSVGNDDVAATAAASMTGKMNLQFASSATLVPMDYAALNIPSADSTTTGTTYTVTIDGTEQATGATANTAYTYTITDSAEVTSVSVGGTTLTANTDYTVTDGVLTIPAEKVTGNIVIDTSVTDATT